MCQLSLTPHFNDNQAQSQKAILFHCSERQVEENFRKWLWLHIVFKVKNSSTDFVEQLIITLNPKCLYFKICGILDSVELCVGVRTFLKKNGDLNHVWKHVPLKLQQDLQ